MKAEILPFLLIVPLFYYQQFLKLPNTVVVLVVGVGVVVVIIISYY